MTGNRDYEAMNLLGFTTKKVDYKFNTTTIRGVENIVAVKLLSILSKTVTKPPLINGGNLMPLFIDSLVIATIL